MSKRLSVYILLIFNLLGSCMPGSEDGDLSPIYDDYLVLMVIDESSIDNGIEPNNFSETDVNDQIASVGQRAQLKFFKDNVGKTIDLNTGQVGDEGWFALKNIPNRWVNAGPTDNGAQNYLTPGPGLGAPNIDGEQDILLDEIPLVAPMRATGLKMLVGSKVLAVVYDSDISINYSPLEGNLQGANLGLVAFEVLEVKSKIGSSDSELPVVTIKILNVESTTQFGIVLFSNAPEPFSSSEPKDTNPPSTVDMPVFVLAN
jgi:hypothetical protein